MIDEYQEAHNKLQDVCDLASTYNWDDFDGIPITQEVCDRAIEFLDLLEGGHFPSPEIMALPNGFIAFQWIVNPYKRMQITIGEKRTAHVCCYFGSTLCEFEEKFHPEDGLPNEIGEALNKVLLRQIGKNNFRKIKKDLTQN